MGAVGVDWALCEPWVPTSRACPAVSATLKRHTTSCDSISFPQLELSIAPPLLTSAHVRYRCRFAAELHRDGELQPSASVITCSSRECSERQRAHIVRAAVIVSGRRSSVAAAIVSVHWAAQKMQLGGACTRESRGPPSPDSVGQRKRNLPQQILPGAAGCTAGLHSVAGSHSGKHALEHGRGTRECTSSCGWRAGARSGPVPHTVHTPSAR
jgi:hypothetical protein